MILNPNCSESVYKIKTRPGLTSKQFAKIVEFCSPNYIDDTAFVVGDEARDLLICRLRDDDGDFDKWLAKEKIDYKIDEECLEVKKGTKKVVCLKGTPEISFEGVRI